MFAVPGWAVSANSLVKETSRDSKVPATSAENQSLHTSQKRKRASQDHPSRKIAGTELEKLWNQKFNNGVATVSKQSKKVSSPRGDSIQNANSTVQSSRKNAPNTISEQGKKGNASQGGENNMTNSQVSQEVGKAQRGISEEHRNNRKNVQIFTKPAAHSIPPQPVPPLPTSKLTPLQAKMRSKLTSARFRHLNQTLYTTSSKEALDLFTNSPELFADYHAGFSQQVKDSWPQNPVDVYIQTIKTRGKLADGNLSNSSRFSLLPLPRRKTGSCTIADLGCGDAPLARGCQSQMKTLQLKFHNFDLHASNSHITVADISNLPLRDGEADIAIFCLSLMGTNWLSFVEEAWRVLRGDGKGEVWVAEVKSRFGRKTTGRVVENSVGKKRKKPTKQKSTTEADEDDVGEDVFLEDSAVSQDADETDISAFVSVFSRRGFMLKQDSIDKSNKMFVSMVFFKSGVPTAGKHKGLKWNGHEYQRLPEAKMKHGARAGEDDVSLEEEAKVLKPCVYKTR